MIQNRRHAIDPIAHERIDSHEELCTLRHAEIKHDFEEIHTKLDKVIKIIILWSGAIALLAVLLSQDLLDLSKLTRPAQAVEVER